MLRHMAKIEQILKTNPNLGWTPTQLRDVLGHDYYRLKRELDYMVEKGIISKEGNTYLWKDKRK